MIVAERTLSPLAEIEWLKMKTLEINKASWIWALGMGATLVGVNGGWSEQVRLDMSLAHPTLNASEKMTTYLKVGLTGFELESDRERPPVNVAIVLDKSGSMSGEKIVQARDATIQGLRRLGSRDIASVVAYDTNIDVTLPATKLTSMDDAISKVRAIESGGRTALFAGVSRGVGELRKFLDEDRVNRVVLLSDGKANVGPSSPAELGALGGSLTEEGISVSTIGLGLDYNEDLMVQLADRSDGNHYFVESASQLGEIFDREFGDTLSVVAQEVSVTIRLSPGARPVRGLGRDVDIAGQTVRGDISQIYSGQEQYLLLEIEVDPKALGEDRQIASAEVVYANMATNTEDRLSARVSARLSELDDEIEAAVNKDVLVASVMQIAVGSNERAIELRDKGMIEEAERLLLQNRDYLYDNYGALEDESLRRYGEANGASASNLRGGDWVRQRKLDSFRNNSIIKNQGGFLQNSDQKPVDKP